MAKGLYTNAELLDSLIEDLNRLFKYLIDNQFIAYCTLVGNMGQKIRLLKRNVQHDLDEKDGRIEELKRLLHEAGTEVKDMTPEEFAKKYEKKDGDNNAEG